MSAGRCKVCGSKFFKGPLLYYKNMPKAAQFLPDRRSLKDDRGVNLAVCQCSGCGLVQLDHHPVPYYREVVRAAGFSPEMKEFRKKQFSAFVKEYSLKHKKVIEIGCGRGEYLGLMRQCGVRAYGIEYAKGSVDYCLKNGLKVSRDFIRDSECKLKHAPFKAFFILNFLEHLPDPNSCLRGICNNLDVEGVGIIEVPNFGMILRKKLFSEFITDHLLYFTRDTLATALELNGFSIIKCDCVWHDYILSAIVRKRRETDLSDFGRHQAKLKHQLDSYTRRFKSRKVVIWGAGHQALAAISLLGLKNKVKYVVDSAGFKQGKFTPFTHIPILSPDTILSDPPAAIIVMAAGYSGEVVKNIRRKFDRSVNVAVLRDFGLETVGKIS